MYFKHIIYEFGGIKKHAVAWTTLGLNNKSLNMILFIVIYVNGCADLYFL